MHPLYAPYVPLHAPYAPAMCPYVPPTHPLHAPMHPLCAPTCPYAPPTCPYVTLRTPYTPPTYFQQTNCKIILNFPQWPVKGAFTDGTGTFYSQKGKTQQQVLMERTVEKLLL